MQHHWNRSRSAEPAGGRLPRAIAIACDGRLEWEIFDVLRRVDGIRVTACSGLRHVVDLCSSGSAEVAVLDLDHLRLDASIHEGLGSLIGDGVRLILIASALAPAGLDVTRMRWMQRPVSAEHVVFALRSMNRQPYLRRQVPR
jgi:hypothetical protein